MKWDGGRNNNFGKIITSIIIIVCEIQYSSNMDFSSTKNRAYLSEFDKGVSFLSHINNL